jgi:vacuolar-type H+-ATPase subunit H
MANKNSNTPPQVSSADQAIRHVLEAERETRHAITECEQAAHALLHDARQRARHIHIRTDRRISNMKVKVAQRISATLKDMGQAEARAMREQAVQPLDETGLSECIEQVACLLSGGTPEDDKERDPGQ